MAFFQRTQCLDNVVLQLAEKDRRILTAYRLFLITSDLLRRDIEREDAPVEIRRHDTGANRRDDSFVERAQVCQRLRRREQTNVGARLSLGKSRREQADYQKRD